jgi:hypothetical protein
VKKFHLFAGDTYYPTGFGDYVGSFENANDAIVAANAMKKNYTWVELVQHKEDGSLELLYVD